MQDHYTAPRRPWLLQFGNFVMATEAREELGTLAVGLDQAEYVDKIWTRRYPGGDPTRGYMIAAPSKAWPYTSSKTQDTATAKVAPKLVSLVIR